MLRVRVAWTGPSSPLLSTHYFHPSVESTSTATACFTAVATFWNTIRPRVNIGFAYSVQQQVDQLDLSGSLTGSFTATNTANAAGTDSGDLLPTQTQGEVAFLTGSFLSGRRLQGRVYVPGPTEASNTAGVPIAAYLTDLNSAGATYAADATNVNPSVWSRSAGAISDIDSAVARSGWRVLRSRR
jgi:hypothetical protein